MLQKFSSYNSTRKERLSLTSEPARVHTISPEDIFELQEGGAVSLCTSSSQISRPNSCDSSLVRESQIRKISGGTNILPSSLSTPQNTLPARKNRGRMMSVMRGGGGSGGPDARAAGDDSEIFLRNPKTGGFDYSPPTPHASPGIRYYNDQAEELPLQGDQSTLNDSTIYTTYTNQPLLPQKQREFTSSSGGGAAAGTAAEGNEENIKKKGNQNNQMRQSFQRYFHMKASKIPTATLYSPPERGGADMASMIPVVSPSPTNSSETMTNSSSNFSTTRSSRLKSKKSKNSFLQQFKSSLRISSSTLSSGAGGGGSPSRNRDGQHRASTDRRGRERSTDDDNATNGFVERRRGNQQYGQRRRRTSSRGSSQSGASSSDDQVHASSSAANARQHQKARGPGSNGNNTAATAIDYKKEAQRIMNSASRRTGKRPDATTPREEAMLITPPRSGRSPREMIKDSSSARNDHPLLDDEDDTRTNDAADDYLLSPSTKSPSSLLFQGCNGGSSDPGSLVSSIIDWSFSSMGSSNKKNKDASWTFDAVSPVRRLVFSCGGATGSSATVDDDDDMDSVVEGSTTQSLGVDSSGFDADNDNSTIGEENGNHRKNNSTTRKNCRQPFAVCGGGSSCIGSGESSTPIEAGDAKPLDIVPRDAVSLASGGAGALLLTEEGLKRHNDEKLKQEQIEPLTLRQQNGVGKLEKEVLKQKMERLQAKEVKKKAETSLQEERAARRIRRLMKARQEEQQVEITDTARKRCDPKAGQQQGRSVDDGVGSGGDDAVVFDGAEARKNTSREEATPQKRSSPPRMKKTPDSTSPQTSLGESTTATSPANNHKKSKSGSFLKKVGLPWKKKPTAEQLKRQWKERERQRVLLAQREKEEAERKEHERIEQMKQSYLEKQRQLERAAAAVPPAAAASHSRITPGSEVDVDDLIDQRQQQHQPYRFHSAAFDDDKTQKQGPSSHLDDYIGNRQYNRANSVSSSGGPSITAGSLPNLGSFSTSMSNPGLGPCIVCQKRERTHIAMPCMHFAFCEHCVKNQNMCPMCTMENVTFSRVNTE